MLLLDWLRRLVARQSSYLGLDLGSPSVRDVTPTPVRDPDSMPVHRAEATLDGLFQLERLPGPQLGGKGDYGPWAEGAVELHRSLIGARLAGKRCRSCGNSLATSALLGLRDGTFHDDLRLADEAAARLLAATERVIVECAQCRTVNEV